MPLWHFHYSRLQAAAKLLRLKLNPAWTSAYLEKQLNAHAHAEQASSVRMRLTVYRKGRGKYSPETNEAAYLIEAEPLTANPLEFKEKGLSVEIYLEHKKPLQALSNIKSANALLFVLAAIYKQDSNLDDCLLLNSESRLAEAISSNVFIVKDNLVLTPLLAEGCVAGCMRALLLQLMEQHGQAYHETRISINEVKTADEIFICNAVQGIQWVQYWDTLQFKNKASRKIHTWLADYLNA